MQPGNPVKFFPDRCPRCGCPPHELHVVTKVRVRVIPDNDGKFEWDDHSFVVVSTGIRVHSLPEEVDLRCGGLCPPWRATVMPPGEELEEGRP